MFPSLRSGWGQRFTSSFCGCRKLAFPASSAARTHTSALDSHRAEVRVLDLIQGAHGTKGTVTASSTFCSKEPHPGSKSRSGSIAREHRCQWGHLHGTSLRCDFGHGSQLCSLGHLQLLKTLNTTPFCIRCPELVSVAETRTLN